MSIFSSHNKTTFSFQQTCVASFILFFLILTNTTYSAVGVSKKLSYQGRLTDTSGSPYTGTYYVCLSIFDAASAGTKLWPTGTPTNNAVVVTNGVFNVALGDADNTLDTYDFTANDTTYLNVSVSASNAACGTVSYEDLLPRQRMDSVASARLAYSLYGGDAQLGTGAGVVSGQKILKLDVKSVADTVGAGSCTPNGGLWYNSGNGRTLVCNNNLFQVVGSGMTNQFFEVLGPATNIKSFTFPNASATVLTTNAAVTIAQGGTGTTTKSAGFDALAPLTTKGDLIGFTSTTSIRLPVGSAGQILAASSTSSTGLEWVSSGTSIGGANTQIQFNNSGGFGGSTDFTWNDTTKTLTLGGVDTEIVMQAITTEPTAAAAGTLKIYTKNIAGRIVPKWVGPSGVDTPFQAALYANNISYWTTTNATAGLWQGTVGASAGTFANTLPSTTNFYTNMKRAVYSTVVTTLNQQVGQRSTENMWWRGSVTGQGGFFFYARFGTEAWTAGDRLFVGLNSGTTAIVTGNPSALLNFVGFAIDAGDTAITFMHNDGTSTATKDTIAGQPTIASNQGYEAFIFARPNDTTVYYRLVDLNTGSEIINSSTTTDLPVNTTQMAAHALMSNGANPAVNAARIGLNRMYIETDF